ncbi:succinylglutamate desuccinylase / Aspartoacylase family protein, partial [Vibrio parahaemolyticus AQ3810]
AHSLHVWRMDSSII